jgi:hypothetical protein
MPRFGSFKYSVTRLVEKGIIVGLQSGRTSEKMHLTISSDDVGVFLMVLTSSQYTEDVQTGSEEIKLEDLLQLQYLISTMIADLSQIQLCSHVKDDAGSVGAARRPVGSIYLQEILPIMRGFVMRYL